MSPIKYDMFVQFANIVYDSPAFLVLTYYAPSYAASYAFKIAMHQPSYVLYVDFQEKKERQE